MQYLRPRERGWWKRFPKCISKIFYICFIAFKDNYSCRLVSPEWMQAYFLAFDKVVHFLLTQLKLLFQIKQLINLILERIVVLLHIAELLEPECKFGYLVR